MTTADHVYVIGSVAKLLLTYLNNGNLNLPLVREQLHLLEKKPHMPISMWWSLLEKIYTAYPIAGLGLQIGQCIEAHHVGVLGYLMTYCNTVEQALFRFSRFQSLVHNLVPSALLKDEKTLTLFFEKSSFRSTLLSDQVVLASIVTGLRKCFSIHQQNPIRVEFRQPAPSDIRPFEVFFGCPVLFNCEQSAIIISIEQANSPIRTQDSHLVGILEQQAQALLQANIIQDAWITEIQEHLVSMMQDTTPSIGLLAKKMGLSQRTLHRQLHTRGIKYQNLLNDMRYELAKKYLKDEQLSLAEVSLLLGFSDQSVFSRVFKKWSGESPLHYRKSAKKLR